MGRKGNKETRVGLTSEDLYELRLRKDGDGFDLTSDGFRRGPIWYSGPDAVRHAVEFARFRSGRLAQDATVRVLDAGGAVIHTYKSSDDFREQNAANQFALRADRGFQKRDQILLLRAHQNIFIGTGSSVARKLAPLWLTQNYLSRPSHLNLITYALNFRIVFVEPRQHGVMQARLVTRHLGNVLKIDARTGEREELVRITHQ